MKLYLSKTFQILTILIFALETNGQAVVGSFIKNRPDKTIAITNDSPRFILGLDYGNAFKVDVDKYISSDQKTSQFCWAYPSIIEADQDWSTTYPSSANGLSSDNILWFKDYYFILDTATFKITATQNFQDMSTSSLIPSSVINTPINEDFEIPWFVVDRDQSILFIITSKVFISYPLRSFFDALKAKANIPSLQKKADYHGFETLNSVAVHEKHLYISADGNIYIYLIAADGSIQLDGTVTKVTINADNANFGDITFDRTGKYLFALDQLSGVQIFNIERVQAISWVADSFLKVTKADFIQIIDYSMNVIVSSGKSPSVTEYIIKYDATDTPKLIFNRKLELSQSVKDVYSDNNFLYLISGYINIALKHSIPGTYNNSDLDFVSTAWISFGSVTMVSTIEENGDSSAVVLTRDYIEKFSFIKSTPELVCNLRDIPIGLYTYQLEAVQSTCDLKQINNNVDFDTVCIIKETLNLIVGTDNSNIGDTTKSNYLLSTLVIGTTLLIIMVILLICNVKRQKNKYQLLEHQMRSQSNQLGSSKGPENVLNLDTSVRNQDGSKGSGDSKGVTNQSKKVEDETKEETDGRHGLGDKPLDVKGIYGDDTGDNPF